MLAFSFPKNINTRALGNPFTYNPSCKPTCKGINLLASSDGILIGDCGKDRIWKVPDLTGTGAGWDVVMRVGSASMGAAPLPSPKLAGIAW